MKKSINSFLQMSKFEAIRIFRNKFLLFLLITFSIILVVTLDIFNVSTTPSFAIYCESGPVTNVEILDVAYEDDYKNMIINTSSFEEGFRLLQENEVAIFIVVDDSQTPAKLNVYYDSSSFAGSSIKNNIANQKDTYANKIIKEYIVEEYGIKVKDSYFNFIEYTPSTVEELDIPARAFSLEVSLGLSLILMLGLAYSVAKNNESNVYKNVKYLPIGTNQFLLSKILPYLILGITQMLLLLIIGWIQLKIVPQLNVLAIIILSIPFILSTISIGLLFSSFKNQVSAIFVDLIVILIPLLLLSMNYVPGMPTLIQIILYSVPFTPFVLLLNGMLYSGIVIWKYVLYLLIQIIIYYALVYVVYKYKREK